MGNGNEWETHLVAEEIKGAVPGGGEGDSFGPSVECAFDDERAVGARGEVRRRHRSPLQRQVLVVVYPSFVVVVVVCPLLVVVASFVSGRVGRCR